MKPGKNQRAILAQMDAGAQLYRETRGRLYPRWYTAPSLLYWRADSCEGLRDYGYVMFDGYRDGHEHYVLTEQGKAAIAPREGGNHVANA